MTPSIDRARRRAAGAAIFLLLTGAVLGVTADRLWFSPGVAEAIPSLTAQGMADRLGLSAQDEARLNALLDTLHQEVLASVAEGPESLRAATDAAHRRIEASLPPEARSGFHGWMREHHEQMMHQMNPGRVGRGPMGPGMHRQE